MILQFHEIFYIFCTLKCEELPRDMGEATEIEILNLLQKGFDPIMKQLPLKCIVRQNDKGLLL